MTPSAPRVGNVDTIMATLRCDEATAEQVRVQLASVLQHRATQAFLTAFLHLSRTTFHAPPGRGPVTSEELAFREGQRSVGLFLIGCAHDRGANALDVHNYQRETSDDG